MSQNWNVGDKVTPNPATAWVHNGTEFEDVMSRPRIGVVIEVPLATRAAGRGTLSVQWHSLTTQPLNRKQWWTHSDLVLRVE